MYIAGFLEALLIMEALRLPQLDQVMVSSLEFNIQPLIKEIRSH